MRLWKVRFRTRTGITGVHLSTDGDIAGVVCLLSKRKDYPDRQVILSELVDPFSVKPQDLDCSRCVDWLEEVTLLCHANRKSVAYESSVLQE